MNKHLERAADAVERETATARPTAIARAAILAYLDDAWVEEIARAISAADDHGHWTKFDEIYRDECRNQARAVLAALRKPLEEQP